MGKRSVRYSKTMKMSLESKWEVKTLIVKAKFLDYKNNYNSCKSNFKKKPSYKRNNKKNNNS